MKLPGSHQPGERWRLRAILVPCAISIFTGPISTIACATIAFALGASIFYDAWLIGLVLVLAMALFGVFAGWIIGAYSPTFLAFALSSRHRLRYWGTTVVLVTAYGGLLLLILCIEPEIAMTIAGSILDMLIQWSQVLGLSSG